MAIRRLRLPALAIQQGDRTLYGFAVDGKELPRFTTVSRVHRDDEQELGGYQRPEAIAHIKSIRRYLESTDALLPNALVVAFDGRVKFKRTPGQPRGSTTVHGEIAIPIDDREPDDKKPGWVVDGQQRSAALRDARLDGFPVFVTAFITDSVAEQRSQFILVNSTKPLPKGLIHELLPSTPQADLPVALLRRRYPALLLERLNFDEDSPMRGMIRTPTTVGGSIKDNSVLRMLGASLEDGALYTHFDSDVGDGDTGAMLDVLKAYWSAVAEIFPRAWRESPRHSRLVHGVGIVSMGCLMDEMVYVLEQQGLTVDQAAFEVELARLAGHCQWMAGEWMFSNGDRLPWHEVQNTSKHVLRVTEFLLARYRDERRCAEDAPAA